MAAAILLAAVPAAAQPAPPATPASVHRYVEVSISPKGDLIAAVESDEVADTAAPEAHGVVVVRKAATGAVVATYDPCNFCVYAGVTWSPSGELTFISSDRKMKNATIEVIRDGRPIGIGGFDGLMAAPRWSPDGKTLAVLATAKPRKETGATQAGAALVGEIGGETDEQRIGVLPADGGPPTLISPADTFIYEYDWTPDSTGFAATAAKGDGDNNWWIARLVAVGLDKSFREIAAPPVQMKFPRVSPDGLTVAFEGGLHSDFGPAGGDLWTAPFAGGPATNRTPDFKGSFSSLIWRKTGLFATALMGDHHAVLRLDPATGATKVLVSEPITPSAGDGRVSISADGKLLAAATEDFTTPPHIAFGPIAKPRWITHENDALAPQVTARSITWKNGGYDVQGWLTGPLSVEPGKTYPMIVVIHGGPSSAVQPTYLWKGTVSDFVRHGYFVFQANPRGSFGQGQAFTRANIKDFGGGDLTDILTGVDAVEKQAPVDDNRLGVFGHSYGGFMTMWTVTHSQRFKAAVAGAGISNWVSYYGQNGIDKWMVPFFGSTVYDDASVYDRLSPVRYVKQATTPTFLYVGERDVECPPAQSLEFWHGLQAMGVPSSLVIYEGEGHAIRSPAHQQDLRTRMLGWFDSHLSKP